MRRLPSRRGLLLGAASTALAASLGGCDRLGNEDWFPRTLDTGEDANLFVQRLLLREATLAPEYTAAEISPWFKPNGTESPPDRAYKALARRGFRDFHLVVDGLVDHPLKLSLAELRALPSRTQITRHDCVEGWSCIGGWTGVPLSELLQRAGLKPQARYIVFHCADTMEGGEADSAGDGESDDVGGSEQANPNMTKRSGNAEDKRDTNGPSDAEDNPPKRTSPSSEPVRYYESIDLVDAYHPQTILAYAMNGQPLPVAHGAPLRLRLERQLGYKQAKYVMHIEVVESYTAIGRGQGGYWEDQGYAWYAGI
ncbi:molybdopterin oxidoreductase [Methylobacterium terricola]|uniref:Molybdopterin oxidoreductase n=1 Tax=Methylobacterium terricola TaxID=2583531 RepID=A0A5C4L9H9_9HYPH|nr:molybdopterin-dependent oxidoreductase [Methylobacterium terricola]TNC08769.1 molybdopterin oxidoreductase [Methylobacterium terricola]